MHLPTASLPGAQSLYGDPAGQAVAAQVFGRRVPSASAEISMYLGRPQIAGRVAFSQQTVGTGTAAPALTANKPGATTAISTWVTLTVNGTDYVIPLWLPT